MVVSKHYGKFEELIAIGVSSDTSEIETLVSKAKEWIESQMVG